MRAVEAGGAIRSFGALRSRMTLNTEGERGRHGEEILDEADDGFVPMSGMWKFAWNRSPKASMIVSMRMVNPQNVKAWASPARST